MRSVVVNVFTGCPLTGSTSVAIRCNAPLTILEGGGAGCACSARRPAGDTSKAKSTTGRQRVDRMVLLIEVPRTGRAQRVEMAAAVYRMRKKGQITNRHDFAILFPM